MGVVPCKDRFFLDAALKIIRPGIEETVALTMGENTYYGIVTELYAGTIQLSMAYIDETGAIPEDKEQAAVIHKLLTDGSKGCVGYAMFQLWPQSFHVYQGYLAPEYRNQGLVAQGMAKFEKQARLLGAPYLSICTKRDDTMKAFGMTEVYSTYRKGLK